MSHDLMMQLGMINQSNDKAYENDCQSSESDQEAVRAIERQARSEYTIEQTEVELMQTVEYKVLMCDIPDNPLFIN